MANPPVTSTEFIGSHEKANAGYGQNGDKSPSSVQIGKAPPLGNKKVAPPDAVTANANAKFDDARLAEISGKPVKAHDGMRNRSTAGKTVPDRNVRRSRTDGVGRPTK